MKNIIKNKKLTILLLLVLISSLIGLFFITILKETNKEIIINSLDNYLEIIKNNKLTYQNSLINNILVILIIWLLGISLIGIPIVLILLMFKTFSITFTYTSIIAIYKFKGILLSSIYIIPHIINLLVMFFLSYYSINFSIMLFNNLFRKKSYNKNLIVKTYLKILIISLILIIISTIIEIYIIPNIIKFIYF